MTHTEAVRRAIDVLRWKGTPEDIEAAERLTGVGDCVKFAAMMRDVGTAMAGDADRFLTQTPSVRVEHSPSGAHPALSQKRKSR